MATAAKTETLSSAMALAFAEIEGATKSATNPHFKTKYADLGAVIDAIKPALINHGLFFTQHNQPSEHGVTVETVLHHVSGDKLSLGALYVPANKQDAQGFGSALTYARRYSLMTAFGVPAEDDDGNAAARSAPTARAQNGHANDIKPAATVNEEQWNRLIALCETARVPPKNVCDRYNVESLKEIPAAEYQGIAAALERTVQNNASKRQKEPA